MTIESRLEDMQNQLTDVMELLKTSLSSLNENVNKIDLSRSKNVVEYLEISKPTLYNMINDGRLKKDIHYKKVLKNKTSRIVFIESAIIKYKKDIREVL
jgi:predicted DNA-binding transcriptional regulator AlpA